MILELPSWRPTFASTSRETELDAVLIPTQPRPLQALPRIVPQRRARVVVGQPEERREVLRVHRRAKLPGAPAVH